MGQYSQMVLRQSYVHSQGRGCFNCKGLNLNDLLPFEINHSLQNSDRKKFLSCFVKNHSGHLNCLRSLCHLHQSLSLSVEMRGNHMKDLKTILKLEISKRSLLIFMAHLDYYGSCLNRTAPSCKAWLEMHQIYFSCKDEIKRWLCTNLLDNSNC